MGLGTQAHAWVPGGQARWKREDRAPGSHADLVCWRTGLGACTHAWISGRLGSRALGWHACQRTGSGDPSICLGPG